MKRFAFLVFTVILALGLIACDESSTREASTVPTATPSSSAASADATQPAAADPTDTPAPDPTDVAAVAPDPTDTPQPTVQQEPTIAPTEEAAAKDAATSAPDPTATAVPPAPTPVPTATTVSAPTLAPAATPEPTQAPEPEPDPTPAADLPIAAELAPLGDNLRFVAQLDRATQKWSVYDADGNFTPDDLPLLPGMERPDASQISSLTELVQGRVYSFFVHENQTAELNGRSFTLYQGNNPLPW